MRLELSANADTRDEAALTARLERLKSRLDHQCLFSPGMEFANRPSTLENITEFLAQDLGSEWKALTVWESEHLGCRKSDHKLTLIFKQRNLTLELQAVADAQTGIAVSREAVHAAVEDLLVKLNSFNDEDLHRWGEKIFAALKVSLPALFSLRVDLGRHEGLVVHSGS